MEADIYYEIKNEGFYSPKVFEAYVSRPVFELAGAGSFNIHATLFGAVKIYYQTQFNLAKVRIGAQYFLSTRYFDNACFMIFGRFEGLSLNHDLRTNIIQCENNLLEDFTRLTPLQKQH